MACRPFVTKGTGTATLDPVNPGDLFGPAYDKAYSQAYDAAKLQCQNQAVGSPDCKFPVFAGISNSTVTENIVSGTSLVNTSITISLDINWECVGDDPATHSTAGDGAAKGACGKQFTITGTREAKTQDGAETGAKVHAEKLAHKICASLPCPVLKTVGTPTNPVTTSTVDKVTIYTCVYTATYMCVVEEEKKEVPVAPGSPGEGKGSGGDKGGGKGGCVLALFALGGIAIARLFRS
jgi:hypothetical protein